MYIVELTYPGTWLEHPDRDWCWRVENQIRGLENPLIDAALSLSMFDAERAKPRRQRVDREVWERDAQRRREIEAQVHERLGIDRFAALDRWEEVRHMVEMAFKREQWSAGRLPDSYDHRLIFLHARSFLFAMDRLDRCLAGLVKEDGLPPTIAQAHGEFRATVPHLRGVRDSVSHYDERSRGQVRGQHLQLKPVMNQAVHAPGGGVLMLESLINNRFGSTMAKGSYGEVEVSAKTLHAAVHCVQQTINAFSWRGPKQHLPR